MFVFFLYIFVCVDMYKIIYVLLPPFFMAMYGFVSVGP